MPLVQLTTPNPSVALSNKRRLHSRSARSWRYISAAENSYWKHTAAVIAIKTRIGLASVTDVCSQRPIIQVQQISGTTRVCTPMNTVNAIMRMYPNGPYKHEVQLV
eukprot:6387904-Amphidinium_carterae.1